MLSLRPHKHNPFPTTHMHRKLSLQMHNLASVKYIHGTQLYMVTHLCYCLWIHLFLIFWQFFRKTDKPSTPIRQTAVRLWWRGSRSDWREQKGRWGKKQTFLYFPVKKKRIEERNQQTERESRLLLCCYKACICPIRVSLFSRLDYFSNKSNFLRQLGQTGADIQQRWLSKTNAKNEQVVCSLYQLSTVLIEDTVTPIFNTCFTGKATKSQEEIIYLKALSCSGHNLLVWHDALWISKHVCSIINSFIWSRLCPVQHVVKYSRSTI